VKVAKTLSDKGNGEKAAYREAEAEEHATLWRKSPKFRAAVERKMGAAGKRKVSGKR
jgi:hypothetical protein